MRIVDNIQLKLCDIQGRLFERSTAYASEGFIRDFMKKNLSPAGETYSPEVLYWIGYLYRFWASSRNEESRKIYRRAPAKTMKRNYLAFHTFDPDIAIDDLIEIDRQRRKQ